MNLSDVNQDDEVECRFSELLGSEASNHYHDQPLTACLRLKAATRRAREAER